MKHVRRQIRNYVTEALKGISDFGGRVYESRIYPLGKEEMPAALIYTENENIEEITKQGCRIQKRYIETVVYIFTRSNDNVEDAIDDLSKLVEDKIYEDQTFGRVAESTTLSSVNLLVEGDADTPVGAARLTFISKVLTQQGKSSEAILNPVSPFK